MTADAKKAQEYCVYFKIFWQRQAENLPSRCVRRLLVQLLKFKFSGETVRVTVDTIIQRGFFMDAGPVEDVIPDSKDVVFYAVTMEKRKTDDAYLVTGNTKHFPKVPFVVTPREMLEIINAGNVQG